MNLWVKRTGQLLVAALFLMACEDENSLLGFKNPIVKFNVNFIDIPLETSVVLIDSVRTDNLQGGTSRLLVGRYLDPLLGEVSATTFAQIRPNITDTIPTTSVYDSLVLTMQLDYYAYGASGTTPESFSVHEITEDSISYSIPIKPYYYNNSLGYGPSMGSTTYSLSYDSLKKQSGKTTPDTTFVVRIKLNENTDFNARLFDLLLNNTDDQLKDYKKFRYAIKGLAITPENPSNSIVGFTGATQSKTRLTMHYHTPTDTLTRVFYLDIGSFSHINTVRTGDLTGAQSYETIEPSNDLRYVQNGSPVITRVDLSSFSTYMAQVPNTLINTAQLIIESIESPGNYTPPSTIYLRTLKEDNLFYNQKKTEDFEEMSSRWLLNDNEYFVVRNDLITAAQPSVLTYNDGTYSTFVTLFLQDMFDKKDDLDLRYLGLYSLDMGKTVNRVAFNKDKIKLRVYYTVPTNE